MNNRATLIKLVHTGARVAFADEAERRAWQKAKTGCESCRDMTTEQLDRLVGELRRKGALHAGPPSKAGRVPFNRSPYMAKVEALLADMGLSWQYAESIAWRLTGGRGLKPGSEPGVQRLEWLRNRKGWEGLIAALEAEQKKRGLMARAVERLNELGLDLADVDQWVSPGMRGAKWQRHLPTLAQVVDRLSDLVNEKRDSEAAD